MRICVTTEHRFERTADGAIWTNGALPYTFWKRYLGAFDHVQVVARVRDAGSPRTEWLRADGEGVCFSEVPYYVGPAQYLLRAAAVRRAAHRAVGPADAVILRVSSPIAACVLRSLARGRPFGLEVIGDPYEALGGINHPLGFVFRRWFSAQLRRECRSASAIAYVTRSTLQQRYRPGRAALSTHYSSIELAEDAFSGAPRVYSENRRDLRIISIGTMEQPYKRFDLLIDAIALCRARGLPIRLVLVGDGRYRPALEKRAASQGIASEVSFAGAVAAGRAVREYLDDADLFVLASSSEGLPRAMIEAMARGLPCVGTGVGGIVELLPPEDLVPRGDGVSLADKIIEVAASPGRLCRMSERNLREAHAYTDALLNRKRMELLLYLRGATEGWLKRSGQVVN